MENPRVVIVVRGGVVTAVYTNGNIDVELADFDNVYGNEEETENLEKYVEEIEADIKMKDVL